MGFGGAVVGWEDSRGGHLPTQPRPSKTTKRNLVIDLFDARQRNDRESSSSDTLPDKADKNTKNSTKREQNVQHFHPPVEETLGGGERDESLSDVFISLSQ